MNTNKGVSIEEAADALNVSLPYLLQLMSEGEIPYRVVRGQRRIQRADIVAYKQQVDAKRIVALKELTDQAQELDMGY